MKQLWYCENVAKFAHVMRCEATLDNGREGRIVRVIPWTLMRESLNFQNNWLALQIIAMSNEMDRLNRSTIVSKVNEAFRTYHRVTGKLPSLVYVGRAEWRDIPLNGGSYYKDHKGREFFMNMRVIRVDLPEWLQVTGGEV